MELDTLLDENRWVAKTNMFGLWIVGPEEDGLINAIGMGRTKDEAIQMAMRSKEI